MQPTTQCRPSSRRALRVGAAGGCLLFVLAALPSPALAQKLEIRNKSQILLGRSRLVDTVTLSDKRYSLGFTNTFREGSALSNVFAASLDATASTKLQFNTRIAGELTDWEVKLNQKFGSFTFDVGGGSDGLFHAGVLFGKRRGKGFGFSAAWVGDDRRRGANLQLWHYIDTIDVVVALRHDRRGFGWSADTGKNLAGILRGVLRYETGTAADGNGASHQVIYGRDMRSGSNMFTGFDAARVVPEEDVFGDSGINIRSPMYPEDDPLAWLVEGYGARFGQVELDTKRLIEAEVVRYVTDTVWVGGEVTMKDGTTDTIDSRFGISGEDLMLSAAFGYAPGSERFSGSVQLRWIPFKPPPPVK